MSAPTQLRPLSVGEVLDVALKIVWRNAGTLVRVVVFVVLPVEIVSALITASASPSSLNKGTSFGGGGNNPNSSDVKAAVAGTLIVFVLSLLSSTLSSGACFRAIASAYLGERTSWRRSLSYALTHVHSLFWVTILASFAAGLGFVLCIIPGVYLWVAFSLAVPVLMTEGLRGRRALGRSRQLVRGYWWRVFGVVLLGTILSSVLSGAIEGVVVGVSTVQAGEASVLGIVVSVVAGTVSKLLTTPFIAAFTTVLYFDLRVRKEAFDLQLLAQRIGVEPGPGALAGPAPPAVDPEKPPFWPPPPGWKPGDGA